MKRHLKTLFWILTYRSQDFWREPRYVTPAKRLSWLNLISLIDSKLIACERGPGTSPSGVKIVFVC